MRSRACSLGRELLARTKVVALASQARHLGTIVVPPAVPNELSAGVDGTPATTLGYAAEPPLARTVLPSSPPPQPAPKSGSAKTAASNHSKDQRRAHSPQHFYQNHILDQYAYHPANTITLRQLVFFGRNLTEERLIRSGNYVRTELPVRLAHRIRDFQNLPFIVGTSPHISLVYDLYWSAFERLRRFPVIKTIEDNDVFCKEVSGMLKEHLVVIPNLARGMMECSEHVAPELIDQFMNTMLRSRISRRVLAEQQISLTENWHDPGYGEGSHGYIGIVNTRCYAQDIIQRCARTTRDAYRDAYNIEPPQVIMDGHVDTVFSYIPDHIEYILCELLKNSISSVIETHAPERIAEMSAAPSTESAPSAESAPHLSPTDRAPSPSFAPLPPIRVTVCLGPTEIHFRVSDQGGGIPETVLRPEIWSFASSGSNFSKVSKMSASVRDRVIGLIPPTMHLGVGLPMSKVYAEYWGGGLEVVSTDGYGTDVYVRITRLGDRAEQL